MATLEWTAWSSDTDEGDPPVIRYTAYVISNTTGNVEYPVDTASTSITLSILEPNTTYEFRVAAVREGEGGTGPPSPPVYATTLPPGKTDDTPSNPFTFYFYSGATLDWNLDACMSGPSSWPQITFPSVTVLYPAHIYLHHGSLQRLHAFRLINLS